MNIKLLTGENGSGKTTSILEKYNIKKRENYHEFSFEEIKGVYINSIWLQQAFEDFDIAVRDFNHIWSVLNKKYNETVNSVVQIQSSTNSTIQNNQAYADNKSYNPDQRQQFQEKIDRAKKIIFSSSSIKVPGKLNYDASMDYHIGISFRRDYEGQKIIEADIKDTVEIKHRIIGEAIVEYLETLTSFNPSSIGSPVDYFKRCVVRDEMFVRLKHDLLNNFPKELDDKLKEKINAINLKGNFLSELNSQLSALSLSLSFEFVSTLEDFKLISRVKGLERPISSLSTGQKTLLALLMISMMNHEGVSTLILEEFDAFLNPIQINDLFLEVKKVKDLEELLLTSHNPITISTLDEEVSYYIMGDNLEWVETNKKNTLKNLLKRTPNLIVDVFDEKIILVEGKTDKFLYEKLFKKWTKENDYNWVLNFKNVNEVSGQRGRTAIESILSGKLLNFQGIADRDEKASKVDLIKTPKTFYSVENYLLWMCDIPFTDGKIEKENFVSLFNEKNSTKFKDITSIMHHMNKNDWLRIHPDIEEIFAELAK